MPTPLQMAGELAGELVEMNRTRQAIEGGPIHEAIEDAASEKEERLAQQAAQIAHIHELAGTPHEKAAAAARRALNWLT